MRTTGRLTNQLTSTWRVAVLIGCFALTAPRGTAQEWALAFDGVNDYARRLGVPGQLEHTYEVICRLSGTVSGKIASQHGNSSCHHGSAIYQHQPTKFVYNVDIPGCGNWKPVSTNVGDAEWHHLAATFDGAVQRIYVDGVLVGSVANASPGVQSGFSLGADIDGGDPGDVEIAEVRFWNHARTQTQLAANLPANSISPAEPGLVALYLLEEGSGQVALDSSPNQYNLQLGNSSGADSADPKWVAVDPWVNLQGGTTGLAGTPVASGSGTLVDGTPVSITLTNAVPNAPMLAWISFGPTPFAALGGTVHAYPFTSQVLLFADAAGEFSASLNWPTGIPSATSVWFQFFVEDVSTVHGITLSNGLKATTP